MKTNPRFSRPGQALVEFALILPLLLLIVLMIVDFGRVIYYYTTLYNAAREGARYGIVHKGDLAGMRNAAADMLIGINVPFSAIDATQTTADPKRARVEITYDFLPVTPLVGSFIGTESGTILIRAVSLMNAEW